MIALFAFLRRRPLPMAPTLARMPAGFVAIDWPDYDLIGAPEAKSLTVPHQTPIGTPAATKVARKGRVASPRASLAHPGPTPATWADCTGDQLTWWRARYSWHSTLFVAGLGGTVPKRSPAELLDAMRRAEAWGRRNRPLSERAKIPAGRTCAEWQADPINRGWDQFIAKPKAKPVKVPAPPLELEQLPLAA